MPLKRAELEIQLEHAKEHTEMRANQLKEKGLTEADYRKDAKWRHYKARYSKINARLNSVSDKESREAEAQKRKAERDAT